MSHASLETWKRMLSKHRLIIIRRAWPDPFPGLAAQKLNHLAVALLEVFFIKP